MSTPVSKSALMALKCTKVQEVPAPEIGPDQVLFVRQLNALEARGLRELDYPTVNGKLIFNGKSHEARWAVVCLCDGNGEPTFTAEDQDKLDKDPNKALARLADQFAEQWPTSLQDRICAGAKALNSSKPDDLVEFVKNCVSGLVALSNSGSLKEWAA